MKLAVRSAGAVRLDPASAPHGVGWSPLAHVMGQWGAVGGSWRFAAKVFSIVLLNKFSEQIIQFFLHTQKFHVAYINPFHGFKAHEVGS
jgi:hypothetical protein